MTVFLLGLDGACLEQLHALMSSIDLPHFREVIQKGAASDLRSVYPYVTAPAWTTMLSGVNPGKHGIFDMLIFNQDSAQPPNLRDCEVPFLWDYLSWANKKILVLGVPFIFPAPVVNGVFVTGRFVPTMSCYPSRVKDNFDLSGYDYGRFLPIEPRKGDRGLLGRSMLENLKNRVKASLALIDSGTWDASIIIDSLPDDLLHLTYNRKDLTEEMFKILDDWVGSITKRMKDKDLLIITSDHGFGEASRVLYLNEWMRSKRYIPDPEFIRAMISKVGYRVPIYKLLKRGRSEGSIGNSKPSPHGGESGSSVKKRIAYSTTSSADAKVVALGLSVVSWVKIQERDETKRASLEKSVLRNLDVLKSQGYLKNIFRTGDLFHGKFANVAPGQLLIEASEGWTVDRETITHGKISKTLKAPIGVHKLNGLLVLYGTNDIRFPKEKPSLLEIAPTVLSCMRLPIPDQLDGEAINVEGENQNSGWKVFVPSGEFTPNRAPDRR